MHIVADLCFHKRLIPSVEELTKDILRETKNKIILKISDVSISNIEALTNMKKRFVVLMRQHFIIWGTSRKVLFLKHEICIILE